jgi:hypothetical protein
VAAEARPALADLEAALEQAVGDVSVVEYALEPWPRRVVRGRAVPTG